jgi:hypothetical protein
MLPVNIHSVIIGDIKPKLRHIHPKIQFVAHFFFLYKLTYKGIWRRARKGYA